MLNTGPTGSGKTTTLYSCLADVNKIEVNITTFEDPVENKMFGLNQSQMRADIGFTFAAGLRSALRQDPDIIMIGEIRDKETLEMAMESAMTGHLVFSTVHTNSAVETITRVLNMGALPYMVAGTFNLVIAQRLGRRVCTRCKTKVSVKDDPHYLYCKKTFKNFDQDLLKEEIKLRNISQEQWSDFFSRGYMASGTGKDPATGGVCPMCGGTGYKGRIGLYEMMNYNEQVKLMLLENKPVFEIGRYAMQHGMIDIERDGLFKLMQGYIDFKEIYRFVKVEK